MRVKELAVPVPNVLVFAQAVTIAMTLRPVDRVMLDQILARGLSASVPVWSRLSTTPSGLQYAVPLFLRVRDFYDEASQKTIASLLHISMAVAA